jgi:hypothetical protein
MPDDEIQLDFDTSLKTPISIPTWLIRAPRSTAYKVVYSLLLSYEIQLTSPGNAFEVNYNTLCSEACISRSTLSKTLKELRMVQS